MRSKSFHGIALMGLVLLAGGSSHVYGAYSDAEIRAVETEPEAKVREIRRKEIDQLRAALSLRLAPNRRGDIYFRLAETYLEAHNAEFLLEGRVFEKRIGDTSTTERLNRDRSKKYLKLGIDAATEIIRFNRPYDRMDRVYHFLGVNHLELGDEKEAMKWFEGLTTRFPDSPLSADGFREQGDFAFRKERYKEAQALYQKSLERDNGPVAARTLQKMAWTYYRTGKFSEAVSTMKKAIERAKASGEKFLSLREEALQDLAIFVTDAGISEDVIDYFKAQAGDLVFLPRVLERLGAQYERAVDFKKANRVYDTLMENYPGTETAFRALVRATEIDLRQGNSAVALKRLQGVKVPESKNTDTQIAAQNLKALVRRHATESHDRFRRSGSKDSLALTEQYYEFYIANFLKGSELDTERAEIQMYLAEIKREQGKSKEASRLYENVLSSKDKRYQKEAAALWTASLAEGLREDAAGAEKRSAPSDREREFIRAADLMQESVADLPEGREAALKAAQVLAGYPSTQEEARERSQSLVKRAPKCAQGVLIERLDLQLLSDQVASKKTPVAELEERVESLESNSELLAADRDYGGGKLADALKSARGQLRVGRIERAEQAKDFTAAAKGYEEFAEGSRDQKVAEQALGSALGSYAKAGDAAGSVRVLGVWQKRYPQSKAMTQASQNAATAAFIQGRFALASELLYRQGKQAKVPEFLETAARISQGSGEPQKAREIWIDYLKVFSKEPARAVMALELALSYEAEGRTRDAIRYYEVCENVGQDEAAECGARLGDMHAKAGDLGTARRAFERVAKRGGGRGKEISPFVAYARYRIAVLMETGKTFTPLQLPEARLKRALNERLDFLGPLSKAYESAVSAGGPFAISSLDRLALFALNFANDLENITPPASADPAAVTQFNRTIQSVAEPLRKRAVDSWLNAYKNAQANEVLSPALPGIVDRLADARVGDAQKSLPSRAQGFRGRFRIFGVPADGGPEGRQVALERVRSELAANATKSATWVDYGNLLWGEGRPLLARVAYDRALDINSKLPSALNNRAVVQMSGSAQEDWFQIRESMGLLKRALAIDSEFLAARVNRAALLNYYRVFSKALPIWKAVLKTYPTADTFDGLAIAEQGTSNPIAAQAGLIEAEKVGASASRFARAYHKAALLADQGPKGASECVEALDGLDFNALQGFERLSADHLKRACQSWRSE